MRRAGYRRAQTGFTLVELIAVLVLTGILAAVALPRFVDRTFDEVGFHDSVKAAVQHARRTAVASRRFTCVNTTASGVALVRDNSLPETLAANVGCIAGCAPGPGCFALALPAPGKNCASNQVCAPSGIAIVAGSSSVIFDPLGRPVGADRAVLAAAPTIRVANQPAIVVQPLTGIVQ